MLFQISQIIAIVTALLLIIFSAFILTLKEKKLNRQLLFIFLIINAVYLAAFLVISNFKPYALHVVSIFYFLHSSGFLFGPVILLYTKSTVGAINWINRKEFIHFIPFVCAVLYIFFRFIIFGDPEKFWYHTERSVFDSILNIQVLFYMVFSLIEVNRYRKRIKNYYSTVEKLNLYWLSIVLYGFFFMWIADFTNFLLRRLFVLPSELHAYIVIISLLTNFIFAVLIFYEGLKRPEFFHFSEQTENKPKYEKSKLTKEENADILNKLLSFMEREKPYLNPAVTINDLSQNLDIPLRNLSQVINNSLNKNFYDFINSYRIEESIKYLSGSENSKKTILEVLYEAGFNSKSTFYKVFKDHTGQNPTEFKKQNSLAQ